MEIIEIGKSAFCENHQNVISGQFLGLFDENFNFILSNWNILNYGSFLDTDFWVLFKIACIGAGNTEMWLQRCWWHHHAGDFRISSAARLNDQVSQQLYTIARLHSPSSPSLWPKILLFEWETKIELESSNLQLAIKAT